MKPTPAEIENGIPRSQRAKIPPTLAKGTPVKTEQHVAEMLVSHVQQQENEGQSDGHDDLETRSGAFEVLELAAPFDVIAAGGQLDLLGDAPLRLGDEATKVPAADVALDDESPLAGFPHDLGRTFDHFHGGQARNRHAFARRRHQQDRAHGCPATAATDPEGELPRESATPLR